MIVNTAYAYMGKATPADPKLWGDGKVYVPYSLIEGATFNPTSDVYGSYFQLPNANSEVDLTINAKGYTAISLKMNRQAAGGVQVTFGFYSGSSLISNVVQRIDNYVTEYAIAIPEAARKAGVTLKITRVNSFAINLFPATMTV